MTTTLEEFLMELGDIPVSRVRLSPPPDQATLADLLAVNQADSRGLFELVDGTLVEKGMSYEASVVAATILFILKTFVSRNRPGLISGADRFFQLQSSTRGPDVAYVARERLPGGVFPSPPYPVQCQMDVGNAHLSAGKMRTLVEKKAGVASAADVHSAKQAIKPSAGFSTVKRQ
ncbi:MAG: Uma2 family endonuclease, partial [Planctomycetales bacterium]|nr:Uma2 family endonuclease [Planctomycetales bacterium]